MLPEVNTTNNAFKVFQSSVAGSMHETEQKRKKKEPTRLKNIKGTKNKDQYSSTTKNNQEKDEIEVQDVLSKQERKKRQKQTRHSNKNYAASAYQNQSNLAKKMNETKAEPFAEI